MFRGKVRRLFLVGIGGSGMCGIAHVLKAMGYHVRGSDQVASPAVEGLRAAGVEVAIGHRAAHLGEADVVVVSTAIGAANPEVEEARRRDIPVVPRAAMLAELMRLKYGIAVAGTHGKTTVTSLVAACLEEGGLDPTVIIGGRLKSLGANARLGGGAYLVAEADESDGSFLRLAPSIAVVTNIDAEHLDHWRGGLPQIEAAFAEFAGKVPFYGAAVVSFDHPRARALVGSADRRWVTYGLGKGAHWRACDIHLGPAGLAFSAVHRGRHLGRVRLPLFGAHNVENALAALAVAHEVDVPFSASQRALARFQGIGRRFEVRGTRAGVLVVDDYAHHPAEIEVTLRAARAAFGRPIKVVFQPHRFSRTRDLMASFAAAFGDADEIFVAEIFPAGERPIPGVDADRLARAIAQAGGPPARATGALADSLPTVLAALSPGDLLLTLGAGNVHHLGDWVLRRLSGETGT